MTPEPTRFFAPIVGAALLIVLAIVFWPVVEAVLQLALVGGIVVGIGVGLALALSGGYVERM